MGGADRQEPVITGDELDGALGRVDRQRPGSDVDGLLPGVHMAVDRAARLEASEREAHLDRPCGLVDNTVAAVARAAADEFAGVW